VISSDRRSFICARRGRADEEALAWIGEMRFRRQKQSDLKSGCSMSNAVLSMRGVQDVIEVYEDRVCITPQGVFGFLNKGLKGMKVIPITSITAVQHRFAGPIVSGYLQFTLSGGLESGGGVLAAAKDENTFMFAKTSILHKNEKDNNELALAIKNYVEQRMAALKAPPRSEARGPASLTEELVKLAELRDKGVLSNQEFEQAKARLLR
jgi:hypothetical protein